MAFHVDPATNDIVLDGFENGIAVSPHKGIGNLQNANINSEPGEVMCNYARAISNQKPISNGTFNANNSNTVSYTGTTRLYTGWVHVTASTITGLGAGYYWMNPNGSGGSLFYPGTYYLDPTQSFSIGNTGSATFNTVDMVAPIQNQPATETYFDSTGTQQIRYYIGDVNGHVWCYDTALANNNGFWADLYWSIVCNSSDAGSSYATASGLVVLNGVLLLFSNNGSNPKAATIFYKQTNRLDVAWASASEALNSNLAPHFAFVNHNGYCFYTDGQFVGQILPSSVSSAGNENIWSYGVGTVSGGNTINVANSNGGYLSEGSFPVNGQTMTFYASNGGSLTNLTAGTVYFVVGASKADGTFQVASTVGGSAIGSISNSGTLFFNSFWPNPSTSNNPTAIVLQALQLDSYEVSQCLTEVSSQLFVGCNSNNIYIWNEVAVAAGGQVVNVQLPENNVVWLVQANNVAYAGVGNKGNIYTTNSASVSLAMTVPDYTAGVPSNANPQFYDVEPYFIHGGASFLRGRIWFSIQDQTANKTGNDGGIWSFVPSFFNPVTGQDTGLMLHLENQNSYGTYNGMATVILPLLNQQGLGAQYFSAWQSDQSSGSAVYGIDQTGTTPASAVIETDLIPLGSYIDPGNMTSIQSRYAAQLQSGESVTVKWRTDLVSAFASFGDSTSGVDNTAGSVGTRWPQPWANALQVQFQITLTPINSHSSFVRFKELRLTKEGG